MVEDQKREFSDSSEAQIALESSSDEIPDATELVIKQADLQMKYNLYGTQSNWTNHSMAAESKKAY